MNGGFFTKKVSSITSESNKKTSIVMMHNTLGPRLKKSKFSHLRWKHRLRVFSSNFHLNSKIIVAFLDNIFRQIYNGAEIKFFILCSKVISKFSFIFLLLSKFIVEESRFY